MTLRPWWALVGAALALCGTGSALAAVDTGQTNLVDLTVSGDAAADQITVSCQDGLVKVNGADPQGGAVRCGSVRTLRVIGGAGNDTIDLRGVAGEFSDRKLEVTATGGLGRDRILIGGLPPPVTAEAPPLQRVFAAFGGGGSDTLVSYGGQMTNFADESSYLAGGPGSDRLALGGAFGLVLGGGGADRIRASAFFDFYFAGTGADVVHGGPGDEIGQGCAGNDVLFGGGGADQLQGGPGADRLAGGPGRDILAGGPGKDRLSGGPGRDKIQQGGRSFPCSGTVSVVTAGRRDPVRQALMLLQRGHRQPG